MGRLKNEMFYNSDWTDISIEEFINILTDYLKWYNKKRIKKSLRYMSPMESGIFSDYQPSWSKKTSTPPYHTSFFIF